jgi:hypothetical protein
MYSVTNTTGDVYDFISAELGVNCDGTIRPALSLEDGASIALCGIAGMPQIIIDDFNVAVIPNSCCTTCKNYSFNVVLLNDRCNPGLVITYIDPITKLLTQYAIKLPPPAPDGTISFSVSINAALGSLNISSVGLPCISITTPVVTDCVVI